MPISPTPPSGAKTSSCRPRPSLRIARREHEDFTGRDRLRSHHRKPAATDVRFHRGFRSGPQARRPAGACGSSSPSPAARASQSARIAGKPAPRIPLRLPNEHRAGKRPEQRLRRHERAHEQPDRSPERRAVRIMPRNSRQCRRPTARRLLGFDQDADELRTVEQAGRSAISAPAAARSCGASATTASCAASAATKESWRRASVGDRSLNSRLA